MNEENVMIIAFQRSIQQAYQIDRTDGRLLTLASETSRFCSLFSIHSLWNLYSMMSFNDISLLEVEHLLLKMASIVIFLLRVKWFLNLFSDGIGQVITCLLANNKKYYFSCNWQPTCLNLNLMKGHFCQFLEQCSVCWNLFLKAKHSSWTLMFKRYLDEQ